MLNNILSKFGLEPENYHIQKFGSGLINRTWKLTGVEKSEQFILQQINRTVFKSPEDIAANISEIGTYLQLHQPDYLFVSPLVAADGSNMVKDHDEYYRLSPYVKGSVTIDTVNSTQEAFEASRQFARFSHLLAEFDVNRLAYTLSGFHDLSTRYKQFSQALRTAGSERKLNAQDTIAKADLYQDVALTYERIVKDKLIPLRVIHHDTKISNILFDESRNGLCVIDLDTVMPGYYISDVGDMMRTYLSPYNEEEQDLAKISVREDIFEAIVEGYFSEMGATLTTTELNHFVYAGKFMIYMQALRFLSDYLNGDVYYHTSYPGHNLVRAKNQFALLDSYCNAEQRFQQILEEIVNLLPGKPML
jgi:Ser/Thr protein kinase RdoA (MazF antagonist)